MTQRNFRVRNGLTLDGTTSGEVNIAAPAVAGTQSYTLPTGLPASNGYVLASQTDGTMSWVDNSAAGTTYDFAASSTTGGANLNLTGSDSTTDTVKLSNGGHITATYTSGTEVTLGSDATDANTVSTIVARDSNGDFSARTITLSGDIAVNGGDITTTSTTASVFNTTATTLNIGGASTATNIGSSSGTTTIGFNLKTIGDINVNDKTYLYDDTGDIRVGNDVYIVGNSIYLNDGQTGTPTLDANITVDRGSSTDASINWDETNDRWSFSDTVNVNGSLRLVGSSSGSSTFTAPASGSTLSYVLPGSAGAANTVLTNDGSGNLSWALPGGGGSTFGNVTIGIDTDQTISTTSGDLILQTAAGVNAGTMTFTAGANGNITLDPDGTGNVAMTLANGGNLTNTRNYVYGAIRNSTTQSNGDIWNAVGGTGYRGVSIDNSIDTNKRPAYLVRSYGGGLGGAPRLGLISESARGTAASPSNLTAGDRIFELIGNGYVVGGGTSAFTGWASDGVANFPALLRYIADETWNDGLNKVGTRFQVFNQPNSTPFTTSSNIVTLSSAANTSFLRSDQIQFFNAAATQTLIVDSSGNLTTTGTLTVNGTGTSIIGGDLQINGNDIKASDGNTNITMTSNTLTAVAGDLQVNGNDIKSSSGNNTITMTGDNSNTTIYGDMTRINNASGVNYLRLDKDISDKVALSIGQYRATSSSTYATSNLATWRSTDGINFTATQSGDTIGEFKFNGNAYTSTSPGVPAGPGASLKATATETWTSTANGTLFNFTAIKTGTLTEVNVISASADATSISSDVITLQDSTGNDYLTLNSTSATFTQDVSAPSFTLDGRSSVDTATLTTTAITQVPLITSTRNVMKAIVYIVQGTDVHTVEALVLRTGASTAMLTTYGEMYNTSSLATFAADTSGGAIRLLVTPANTTSMLFTTVITSLT